MARLRDYLKALRRLGVTHWTVAAALERIQRVEHILSTIDSRFAAIESEQVLAQAIEKVNREAISNLNGTLHSLLSEREHILSTIDSRLAAIESERVLAQAIEKVNSEAISDLNGTLRSLLSERAPPSDRFYSCCEDRFRGSREEIRTRLSFYLPLVQQVAAGNPTFNAVDLGCGRGEWLQLLRDMGYAAVGVDTNDAQLENARLLGLDVKLEDAMTYLRSREDGSIDVITSMHLLEHMPFAGVTDLLRQITRTLAPSGLLILETPNPRNLSVSAFTFHLDPTHNRPLPAELLSFLVETSGLVDLTIIPLHLDPGLDLAVSRGVDKEIAEMLFGPRDYALIAHGAG